MHNSMNALEYLTLRFPSDLTDRSSSSADSLIEGNDKVPELPSIMLYATQHLALSIRQIASDMFACLSMYLCVCSSVCLALPRVTNRLPGVGWGYYKPYVSLQIY